MIRLMAQDDGQLRKTEASLSPASLFASLQEELRHLAAQVFADQNKAHTLQPTALINEAWLKLARISQFEDRAHFFALAAKAMRQILTDHARSKKREKRGGGALRLTLCEQIHSERDSGLDLFAFNEALDKLSQLDERHAKVAEYRLLGSLTNEEIARLLDINERTVKRDWQAARLWLLSELYAE